MRGFDEVVAALAEAIPTHAGGRAEGAEVQVTGMRLDLPLEARLLPSGGLVASLPRGLLATGFDHPHSRVQLTFVLRGET